MLDDMSTEPTPQAPALEADGGNLYRPHPFMVNSGQFWRCAHGTTGFDGNMDFKGCMECATADPVAFASWHRVRGTAQAPAPATADLIGVEKAADDLGLPTNASPSVLFGALGTASQAPAADERAEFEAWLSSDECTAFPTRMHKSYGPDYVEAAERDAAWEGWIARAGGASKQEWLAAVHAAPNADQAHPAAASAQAPAARAADERSLPPSLAAIDAASELLAQAGYKADSSTLHRLAIARSLTLELLDAFLTFVMDSDFGDMPDGWHTTKADIEKLAQAFGFRGIDDALHAAYSE